jgi:hypothetical protein
VTTSEEEYTLVGPEADGRGLYLDNGFLVKAGSLARKEIAPSGIVIGESELLLEQMEAVFGR